MPPQDLLPRLPDAPRIVCAAEGLLLCERCRAFLAPQAAPDHRCYDYRQIHLPSWKRAVRKRS